MCVFRQLLDNAQNFLTAKRLEVKILWDYVFLKSSISITMSRTNMTIHVRETKGRFSLFKLTFILSPLRSYIQRAQKNPASLFKTDRRGENSLESLSKNLIYSLPYRATSLDRYSYLSLASASFLANSFAALSGFFMAREA